METMTVHAEDWYTKRVTGVYIVYCLCGHKSTGGTLRDARARQGDHVKTTADTPYFRSEVDDDE